MIGFQNLFIILIIVSIPIQKNWSFLFKNNYKILNFLRLRYILKHKKFKNKTIWTKEKSITGFKGNTGLFPR